MMTPENLEDRQSRLIQAMRFPLIVLVLYVHSARPTDIPMQWSLDGENVFRIVTEVFSHYIGGLSLCCFFFFSGFLFFHHVGDGNFGKEWVLQKWQRRVRSSGVPYLVWNMLYVVLIVLLSFFCSRIGISMSGDLTGAVSKGPLYWFITGPIDFPLWFLRNLIVLFLLAPVLYHPVMRFPWLSLACLLLLYLLPFSGRSVFLIPEASLFGAGAWMSIRKVNLLVFCRRCKVAAAMLAVVCLIITTGLYNSGYDNFFFLVFAPFGMVALVNLFDLLLNSDQSLKLLMKLAETSFFIFAAHEVFILGWTKGLFLRLMGETLAARWIAYLFVPWVVLAVCLGLYYLLKRISPGFLSILCGFRNASPVR